MWFLVLMWFHVLPPTCCVGVGGAQELCEGGALSGALSSGRLHGGRTGGSPMKGAMPDMVSQRGGGGGQSPREWRAGGGHENGAWHA